MILFFIESSPLPFLLSYYIDSPFLIANMVNLAIRLSVALIFAPRFGIAFVWLAVPAGWLANFLISYVALRMSWQQKDGLPGSPYLQ